jgi:spore germination protein GerM
MPDWLMLVLGGSLLMGLAALLTVFATRKRDKNTDTQERFESTSEMAKYMREEIAKEVERQVGPIRAELETVKQESHEMNSVVRSREVRLWMWERDGRGGLIPQLPAPILARLGLENLFTPPPEG